MAPQIYNMPVLHRQMLEVLGIKHADKLVPLEEDQKPTDPISENQNALRGKPLKAFSYQDHEAHIKVHTSAMNDPVVQQLIGQNPQAAVIQGSMQAHIAEHVGYAYRVKMQQALGFALPDQEDELPEDMERELSRMMAEAAPQVLAQSQAMMAQQQAAQNAQDPVLQLQIQDQQRKNKETEIKEKKLMMDAASKADEIRLKEQEIQSKERLAGMNAQIKVIEDAKNRAAKLQETKKPTKE
jgi:hypothetical protein